MLDLELLVQGAVLNRAAGLHIQEVAQERAEGRAPLQTSEEEADFCTRWEEGLHGCGVSLKPYESKIQTGVECPENSKMFFQANVQKV